MPPRQSILLAFDSVAEAHEMRPYFFRQHLCWPSDLLAAAATKAETEFYRSVIEMTARFLESEASVVLPPR